jgi:hypothetical protein
MQPTRIPLPLLRVMGMEGGLPLNGSGEHGTAFSPLASVSRRLGVPAAPGFGEVG